MPLLHGSPNETVEELDSSPGAENWLVVSPYDKHPHLLNPKRITVSQRLLAKALTVMAPIRDDYATAPYHEAFNWSEVVEMLRSLVQTKGLLWVQTSFYIVVFRSQLRASADRLHLGSLDERSHAEAMRSGGLLKYWFGVPDCNYRNLATCIWNGPEDAKLGGRGDSHKEAARTAKDLYSEWRMERLRFEIGDNAGQWSIREWDG